MNFVRAAWVSHLLLASALARAFVPTSTQAQVLQPSPSGSTPAESPLSLTASDGSGLQLVSLKARAVVEDPLAFTELHLVFHNPEPRQREGRFRITLPQGATISRFAMKINGRFMEGEVVERAAARAAYEDFLHRRQDPALMENEAGNEFSARVFPIPPSGDKELIVSYSQELVASRDPFRLPLRGLPKLGELDIRVSVDSAERKPTTASNLGGASVQSEVIEVHKRDFQPDRDLEVTRRGATTRAGLRHDNLVVARVQPTANASEADAMRSLLVLVDTSASRALGFEAELDRLTRVLAAAAAARDFELQVLAFDQDAVLAYSGRASGWGADDAQRLLKRRAEGASNLQLALRRITEKYSGKSQFDRLLIVSDGVWTAGSVRNDELRAQLSGLAALGVQRADVLAVGGIRDDARLGLLVRGNFPKDGLVLSDATDAGSVSQRLLAATRSGLKVVVPGARWVWPERLDGVQANDELLVYADLPGELPFSIRIDGQPARLADASLRSVERPLLERAWVGARIARLSQQRDTLAAGDNDLRAALSKQIIELSTRHRVLCDGTALLVLETEADYRRFGIERRALSDILSVGASGLEVVSRTAPTPLAAAVDTQAEPVVPGVLTDGRLRGEQRAPRKAAAAPSAPRPSSDGMQDDLLAGSLGAPREAARPQPSAAAPPAAPAPRAQDSAAMVRSPARLGASQSMNVARPEREEEASAADQAVGNLGANSRTGPAAESGAAARVQRSAQAPESELGGKPALEGELAEIEAALRSHQRQAALARALAWRTRDPGDVLGIVALGRTLEASGDKTEAARAYGSIIDLFPGRADLRRFVAGQLEQLQLPAATELALDCLRHAVEDRPDHPSSHHLLAMALLKRGKSAEAFAVIESALKLHYPDGRFRGVDRILREDLGLCAAAWTKDSPDQRAEIERRLQGAGGVREETASVRFVLTWETDANDVDFHIHDARSGHAFYSSPRLASGGELYADVTTGYGPECFTVREPRKNNAGPYRLRAHYYSRGPMGYGMGRLEIIDHDAKGNLRFSTRPFVVMNDHAYLDLGNYELK